MTGLRQSRRILIDATRTETTVETAIGLVSDTVGELGMFMDEFVIIVQQGVEKSRLDGIVREASINVQGDFDLEAVIETAKKAISELPDQDVLVLPGLRGNNYDPQDDWLLFYGEFIDNALLAAARRIHVEYPDLVLLASDEVGNWVDWASPDTKTPFTIPARYLDNETNTLLVDVPAKVIPIIELQAKKRGHTVAEEASEWITERALSAA